jgi:hypothetical protein
MKWMVVFGACACGCWVRQTQRALRGQDTGRLTSSKVYYSSVTNVLCDVYYDTT